MNFLSKFKKGIASVALAALLGVFLPAVAFGFNDDADIPSWADEAISELGAIGVMTGADDGNFYPNSELNRAEVSKVIVLAADVAIDTTGGAHFPDVNEGDWFYDYVETMYNYGWIDGYPDGTFGPAGIINRAEMAKMVVNAFEISEVDNGPSFSDVSPSDWFYSYVETVKAHAIMLGFGDGTFAPANAVTRAETAKIVYEGLLVATEPSGPAAGTLEVALSGETPRGTNIPYNASSVPFTTLELTASDDSDVEVSAVTLTRLGLGDNDDFDNVWLEIDGFKVGSDRSVNNDDVVELRFNPPIVVPAGQTLVADVVASNKFTLASDGTCFASGSEGCNIGHHNRFAVVSADDIVSTAANTVGDFPIEGEEMEVADYEVSQLVFSDLGSDTTINVGDAFSEIGKFRLLNSSQTNKDIELRAITFKNNGTAQLEDDLENVALYVSGEQVSAETIIDGDYMTFRLDNGVTGGYVIEDGDSRIFSLRADIVSAETGDNITFKIDNYEDVVGIEIGTAFGVKTVDTSGNDAEDANATLKTYLIDSGNLNVSRDPNSLGNQEYAPGSNDVVAMTARVLVQQPTLADGVTINVDSYDTTGATDGLNSLANLNDFFDNFRLYLNDNLVDSENSLEGTDTNPVLNYSSQFEITGASVLKLVINVQDDAATGSFVKFNLNATGFDSPEYISSGDTIQSSDLLGSALASKVEVAESVLTITRTDGFLNETVVAGVTDATFLKFVLDNNDSGDVNVTSVTIKGLGTGAAAANYSNFTAAIFVDGQQVGSSKTLDSSTGTASFNDIAVTIPSAGQEEFTVVMDTIEAAATEALANTTVAVGSATPSVSTAGDITNAGAGTAISADAAQGTSTITLRSVNSTSTAPGAAGTASVSVAIGDYIVMSSDGNYATSGAELRKVTSIVTAGTSTTITVDTPFNVSHLAEEVSTAVLEYPTTASSFDVASTNNMSVGDVLSLDFDGSGTYTGGEIGACTIASISGNTVTCNAAIGTALPVGNGVVEPSGTSSIKLVVIAGDADNAENGSEVKIYEGTPNVLLGVGNDDSGATNLDGDCVTGIANTGNYLCGDTFGFTASGTLAVQETGSYSSDILVAGASNVEVWKLRLSANDDEVQVKDLYLENATLTAGGANFDSRADFMLYNEAGQLLGTEQMISGKVHFNLNSNKIIVPKDGNTYVTVKVNIRNITDVTQTAKELQLQLDTTAPYTSGMEALTGATGSDLDQSAMTGTGTGVAFVAYATSMELDRMPTSSTTLVAGTKVELFRFKVTPDAAGDIYLDTVTLNMVQSAGFVANTAALTVEDASDSNKTYNVTGALPVAVIDFNELLVDTAKEYVVYGDTTSAAVVSGSSISTQISEDTTYAAPDTSTNILAIPSNIVWSDDSDSAGTGDFLNGYLIQPDTTATTISAST